MQPYQEASEATRRRTESEAGFLRSAGVSLAGASSGLSAMNMLNSKIMPFLNKYVPSSLAIKGISKTNANMGEFVKSAYENGYSNDEIASFLTQKAEKERDKKSTTKQDRNIIQQYSPELFSFIKEEVGKGRSPIQAGALAQNDKRFTAVIKKLTKDHKTQWSDILQTVFGMGEMAQQQQNEMAQTQQQGTGLSRIEQTLQRLAQIRGGQ